MVIKELYAKRGSFELFIKDLALKKGTIIGLVGANGAGKTTFMEELAGYGRKASRLYMQGMEKKEILYIPSQLEAYDYLTVGEFACMCVKYSHGNRVKEEELLRLLCLADKRDALISELSEGMRKRLNFTPLFLSSYKIVLLDEPFNSIDLDYIYQLKKMLLERRGEATFLISSHILETLQDLCDTFIFLEEGRVKKTFSGQATIRELEKKIFDTTA